MFFLQTIITNLLLFAQVVMSGLGSKGLKSYETL